MGQIITTHAPDGSMTENALGIQQNSSHTGNYRDFKSKTVLIVEDIPSNYQLLQAYLAPTGATILHAVNGADAIELVNNNPEIHLILMDLRLPDVNGLLVTRMIRQVKPKMPIIAQTAYAMPNDRQECLSSGCNDYIAKPIRRNDFIGLVSKYLESA